MTADRQAETSQEVLIAGGGIGGLALALTLALALALAHVVPTLTGLRTRLALGTRRRLTGITGGLVGVTRRGGRLGLLGRDRHRHHEDADGPEQQDTKQVSHRPPPRAASPRSVSHPTPSSPLGGSSSRSDPATVGQRRQ